MPPLATHLPIPTCGVQSPPGCSTSLAQTAALSTYSPRLVSASATAWLPSVAHSSACARHTHGARHAAHAARPGRLRVQRTCNVPPHPPTPCLPRPRPQATPQARAGYAGGRYARTPYVQPQPQPQPPGCGAQRPCMSARRGGRPEVAAVDHDQGTWLEGHARVQPEAVTAARAADAHAAVGKAWEAVAAVA